MTKRTFFSLTGLALLAGMAVAPAPATAQDLGLRCRLYLAVDQEPLLSDFPILITSARRGRVEVVVASLAWMTTQSGGFGKSFAAMNDREKVLRSLLKRQPGVLSVGIERDGLLDLADVDERRAADIEELCPARLDIRTEPRGARLFVDGQPKGELPAEVEIASGERRLVFELAGHRTRRETIRLQPGERRALEITFERLATLEIETTAPSRAAVLVDGDYVAMTPAVVYVDHGPHTIRLLAPDHLPREIEIETSLGETYPIATELARRDAPACYSWNVDGNVKQKIKDFRTALVGETVNVVLPLPKVVSSVMGSELPTTHVVDGKRILFEARMGDDYVDHPAKLLWRELGGLSFGEVGTDLIATPTGMATVTEVKKKKSTLVVEIRHDNGLSNKVYLDYTAGLDTVSLDEIEDALCWVFAPPVNPPSEMKTAHRGR